MSSADETARDRGQRLRAELTSEERKLWAHLTAERWGGFKFRRQRGLVATLPISAASRGI